MSPAGRPPLGDEAKSKTMQLRVTVEQKKLLDSAAAAIGQPTTTWIRDLALAAAAEIADQAAKPAGKKKAAKKG